MNWYQRKAYERELDARCRRLGIPRPPAEKPLFFGSGRGRSFGRKPHDYDRPAPKPTPKPDIDLETKPESEQSTGPENAS
jgi:hypothetical protein